MADQEKLKQYLREQLETQGLIKGLFRFGRIAYTNTRIDMEALWQLKDGWSQLAADLLLEVPTAGLIGVIDEGNKQNWIREITIVLENRGVELPTTEIHKSADEVWGTRVSDYHIYTS